MKPMNYEKVCGCRISTFNIYFKKLIFGEGANWLFVLGGTCEATNNLLCTSQFGFFILLHHRLYFVRFYESYEGGGKWRFSCVVIVNSNILISDIRVLLFDMFHCFTYFAPYCKFCSKAHMWNTKGGRTFDFPTFNIVFVSIHLFIYSVNFCQATKLNYFFSPQPFNFYSQVWGYASEA